MWKNEAETALFCYNPKGSFILTMPEFILFLGIARGGFSGSSLGSTPLSTYSIFAAVLILSHRLIPRGEKVNILKIYASLQCKSWLFHFLSCEPINVCTFNKET